MRVVPSDHAYFVYLPYLPLPERRRVGEWDSFHAQFSPPRTVDSAAESPRFVRLAGHMAAGPDLQWLVGASAKRVQPRRSTRLADTERL